MDSSAANIQTFSNICKVLLEKLQGVHTFAGYEQATVDYCSVFLCIVIVSFIFYLYFVDFAKLYLLF